MNRAKDIVDLENQYKVANIRYLTATRQRKIRLAADLADEMRIIKTKLDALTRGPVDLFSDPDNLPPALRGK